MKNNPETKRAWAEKNKEKLDRWRKDNKEMLLEKHRQRNKKSPRYAFTSTLAQARKRCDVTIDQDYLMALYDMQEGLCALSGIRMTWATGRQEPTSISMDRIDQSIGYVDGNVRLVCVAVNAFRGIMTDDGLLKFANALVRNMTACKIAKEKIKEVA
jgi:hypothetical protein